MTHAPTSFTATTRRRMLLRIVAFCTLASLCGSARGLAEGVAPSASVLEAEARRVDMMERVSPSVVCVFDEGLRGGGSGVLINADGYGLTNFHVVAGMLNTRKGWGGLGDGILYELEVLGVDITGDVAMFRLIPPKKGYRFPYSELGDSDRVSVGDVAIAMGNPFIVSEDYSPTVTLGIVTGLHRYQEGVKGNLAYTDCIQVDAAINPGNSGGPLFNADGEVIGINGRISISSRGRFNVGFGYAISANQIRRFVPALRAGLLARHGGWQARVQEASGSFEFAEVRRSGPAYDAGIRVGDRLLAFDGVPITSTNQVASLLGTFPEDWPIILDVERAQERVEHVVRLEAIDPVIRRPFESDSIVNDREVRRVLRGFHRAVFGSDVPRRVARWAWTVTRQDRTDGAGGAASAERYEAMLLDDGPVYMRQRYDDGSLGRVIEYDGRSATQRSSERAEAFDLAPDMSMTLNALYVMQRGLLAPVDEMDLRAVTHTGADALHEGGGRGATRVLEVLDWPVNDRTTARLSFDAVTFLLRRIRVRDGVSGVSVSITLGDYCDIGGLSWPSTIEVQGPGSHYEDALADWEIAS